MKSPNSLRVSEVIERTIAFEGAVDFGEWAFAGDPMVEWSRCLEQGGGGTELEFVVKIPQ